MLQQTQVATVLPRFDTWLARFPDLPTLAAADEAEVLKAWQGLGYYRRARLLHAAAGQIMQRHHGRFPEAFAEILALPGIGRSTAGAIASICFGQRRPVLDANVRRVLTRWHDAATAADSTLWRLASHAIGRAPDPAEWNQAMMELGATLCRARTAACGACPLRPVCAGADRPLQPAPARAGAAVRDLHWRVSIHRHPERGIWMVRRPADAIWGGMWTPPIEPITPTADRRPDLLHRLTHRRLHLYLLCTDAPPDPPGRWVHPDEVALPTGIRRLLERAPQ
ncbi:MAG: A/G-specific adenine glycosylase [Zetaproteobacteria bacterium]|nr:MAG: A/G-specific adenine glycosylase [Zetaproteobacteria bacterium]